MPVGLHKMFVETWQTNRCLRDSSKSILWSMRYFTNRQSGLAPTVTADNLGQTATGAELDFLQGVAQGGQDVVLGGTYK